jgi:hypothetical protein
MKHKDSLSFEIEIAPLPDITVGKLLCFVCMTGLKSDRLIPETSL